MTYSEKLNATKEDYPFNQWREYFLPNEEEDFGGMEQYTPENCDKAQQILDDLINDLIKIGEKSKDEDKEKLFEIAIIALNTLNDETGGSLIETGEREDLCELIDNICIAAGLDPEDYGDGEGISDEWREW
jgi:hypothetical protein